MENIINKVDELEIAIKQQIDILQELPYKKLNTNCIERDDLNYLYRLRGNLESIRLTETNYLVRKACVITKVE